MLCDINYRSHAIIYRSCDFTYRGSSLSLGSLRSRASSSSCLPWGSTVTRLAIRSSVSFLSLKTVLAWLSLVQEHKMDSH